MSSLAGKLFCDDSNVTGIVDRLEARGLIERRPAEHDRRVKLLGLTPEGERACRAIAVDADDSSRRRRSPPCPVEHKRALRDALRAAVRPAGRDTADGPSPGTYDS